jgi:metal-responsive CopG/Arc/MetJ family transcriptional regulator
MSKRINIVLPAHTIKTIDRLAKPGMRSKFIKTAVEYYVADRSLEAIRSQLEQAAVRELRSSHGT